MSVKSLSIVVAAALALCAGVAQAQNKFANGGFEDAQSTLPSDDGPVAAPDPTKAQGWIPSQDGYDRSSDAYSGSWSALVHQLGVDKAGVMLQNSKRDGGMPSLVAGQSLNLSFWAKPAVAEEVSFYTMGYKLLFLDDVGTPYYDSNFQNISGSLVKDTWTQIVAGPVVVPVGATSAFLEFSVAGGGRLAALKVDDVMLAVPEPSTYALMLAGLVGVAFLARRRRSV